VSGFLSIICVSLSRIFQFSTLILCLIFCVSFFSVSFFSVSVSIFLSESVGIFLSESVCRVCLSGLSVGSVCGVFLRGGPPCLGSLGGGSGVASRPRVAKGCSAAAGDSSHRCTPLRLLWIQSRSIAKRLCIKTVDLSRFLVGTLRPVLRFFQFSIKSNQFNSVVQGLFFECGKCKNQFSFFPKPLFSYEKRLFS
jgi:hypothetical protein